MDRERIEEERKIILSNAKADYERKQKIEEEKLRSGEGTWMLPGLSDLVESKHKEIEKIKNKKVKKHKKDKKSKKKSKKKSGSNSDDASMWVEKAATKPSVNAEKVKRDDWMSLATESMPCISNQQRRDERQSQKEKEKEPVIEIGQHKLELNPYWKQGGEGMPTIEKQAEETKKSVAGDGGVTWLKRSLKRCQEQAEETGLSIDEIASERYGSLDALMKMIREAEDKVRGARSDNRRNRGFITPSGGRNFDDNRNQNSFRRPKDDDDSRYRRDRYRRSRSRGRRSRSRDRRSRSRDRKRRSRSRDRRSRSRDDKRGNNSRERSSKIRSRDRRSRSRDKRSRSRDRRSRSRDGGRRSRSNSRDRSRKNNNRERSRDKNIQIRRRKSNSSDTSADGSKKKNSEDGSSSDDSSLEARKSLEKSASKRAPSRILSQGWKKSTTKHEVQQSLHKAVKDRSSSEYSTDSSSDSEPDNEPYRSPTPEVIPLSEAEMNKLASKLLNAEIMGNTEEVIDLKKQLKEAREIASRPIVQKKLTKTSDDMKPEVVLLTRTDRYGNVRPLAEPEMNQSKSSGLKRRKKTKKISTHEGKDGKRTRYFDDDDKHNLKEMVEREKLGTAEDQHMMFSRLANSTMKIGDDHQLDDELLDRATKEQSQSQLEDLDKRKAIYEHKKMAASIDKCTYCLDKIEKHLIVSIGKKSFLALPSADSMVENHCLILPIQHVPQLTGCDEDIWNEMQEYRKALTRMFKEEDQDDCVFMQLSKGLQYIPHASIECIPVEQEIGDLAPIYFKKALQECDAEWSQNKKVIDISRKSLLQCVPKAFPYFSVDFGLQGGYAHVIEDEHLIPNYFGREIIGGMLDLEHNKWRKARKQSFQQQKDKVLKFAEKWKKYDFTKT